MFKIVTSSSIYFYTCTFDVTVRYLFTRVLVHKHHILLVVLDVSLRHITVDKRIFNFEIKTPTIKTKHGQ